MLWFKNRNTTNNFEVRDSSRGTGKGGLRLDDDTAEGDSSTRITSFDSDGFTLSTDPSVNGNTNSILAWSWAANGGTRTTNTESGNNPGGGYQANTTAGFSIVDYTGTGAAGTMAHGLGAVPTFMIVKNRDEAESMIGQLIFASITESDPINLISPDLLGATVVADNGEIIGELVDMMSLPANDAYVIERGKKEVLIPVIPEIVRSVDVKMGLVTITPMDGLLD